MGKPQKSVLHLAGASFAKKKNGISDRKTAYSVGVSRKAVNTIWKLYRETKNVRPRKRSGRPRKVTPRVEHRIVRLVTRDPLSSAKKVKEDMEIESPSPIALSRPTVSRVLKKNGLRARLRPNKWLISPQNKIKRVLWCQKMKNYRQTDWEKIVFKFDKGIGTRYVRCRGGQEL